MSFPISIVMMMMLSLAIVIGSDPECYQDSHCYTSFGERCVNGHCTTHWDEDAKECSDDSACLGDLGEKCIHGFCTDDWGPDDI